jgi:hypothetical protein
MRLSRVVPRSVTQSDLTTFECRPCGVFMIEAADAKKHGTRPARRRR